MGFAALTDSYPWDAIAPYAERARRHPQGAVDLSVGTPVDPTPAVVQEALIAAADAPGYPTTHGTADVRETVAGWFARRRGVVGLDPQAVLPTVGSKEAVALLPSLVGAGPGDVVVHPEIAYPTYDVGARLAGATPLATDEVAQWESRSDVKLVWLNSPANPHGAVRSVEELAKVVAAARRVGAVVVSDECYAELAWEDPYRTGGVPSLLDPRVSGGSHEGLLVAYSLSKQSNLAGYRAAFLAGDPALVADLVRLRRHMGMIVPAPVQAAMVAALSDDAHVSAQRERYGARRRILVEGVTAAGLVIDHSEAGLYLWVRPEGPAQDCWHTVADLADLGILVGPGAFYGPAGSGHVRMALTATDERVAQAAARLQGA